MLGDSIGAGLVYHLSKAELEQFEHGKAEGGGLGGGGGGLSGGGGPETVPLTEIEDQQDQGGGGVVIGSSRDSQTYRVGIQNQI